MIHFVDEDPIYVKGSSSEALMLVGRGGTLMANTREAGPSSRLEAAIRC
jgi:hypothetical protein